LSIPVASSRCALRQISQFVKGASRRRAAPGSQSMGSPQSRRLRLGRNRLRGLWLASHAKFGRRTSVEEGFSLKAKASCRAMLGCTQSLLQVSAIRSQTVRPNPSLKRSTNGMPPGLVPGCTHIFQSPGLAASRRCPLSSNVRRRKPAHRRSTVDNTYHSLIIDA
jgi:hypothetical protein